MELRVALETDRIRLGFLKIQTDLMEGLYKKRAVSEYKFRLAETECATLSRQTEETARVLGQAERDLATARKRQETFSQAHPIPPALATTLEPLRAALSV